MTPVPPFPQPQGPKLRGMLIVNTQVVHRRSDDTWFYEIHFAPDFEKDAQRTVLVTKNWDVYQLALKIEGNEAARVDASYHYARRGSYRYGVLDTLSVRAA